MARLYRELGTALKPEREAILDFTTMKKNAFGIRIFRITAVGILSLLLTVVMAASAQSPAKPEPQVNGDITGMYSFIHEGEFVQIEVNDEKVTGLVSCFKDEDQEKAQFVDHFFDQAKLVGTTLAFRTKLEDGVGFEFSGVVERGPAKTPADEGYWNVRGTVTERRSGADGKVTEKIHQLTLRSFPQDAEPDPKKAADKK